jgi:hypothetical protein
MRWVCLLNDRVLALAIIRENFSNWCYICYKFVYTIQMHSFRYTFVSAHY